MTSPPNHPSHNALRAAELAAELAAEAGFIAALEHLERDDERTLSEQIELTRIPAPSFGEQLRAHRFAELLTRSVSGACRTDAVGNVLARSDGRATAAPIVVAAHLDTVFPAETPIEVTRAGDRIRGPGISDDGRGLAAVLALSRVVGAGLLPLARPVLWVGTVGEEGVGDLRGVRHLFRPGGPASKAAAFLSLDGAGSTRIVTRGIGSRRYRLGFEGSGGHSWSDWGVPNPLHALGRVVADLSRLRLSSETTLTVGRMAGGISVNAIPERAWLELDVRGPDGDKLAGLEPSIREAMERSLAETNAERRSGTPALSPIWELFGDRPAGATPNDAPLVVAAEAATRQVFGTAERTASSTDSNVPMSLGIQAVTLGGGGEAGLAHTTEEWFHNVQGPEGIARALLALALFERLSS
jgi:tripeptide aminopeptidase